jgi:spore maturation protein CgeB
LAGRLFRGLQSRELSAAVLGAAADFGPDVLAVYKGRWIGAELVERIKAMGIATANVFPDISPHAHGRALREAVGRYDLVISTKPSHPQLWRSVYGYRNPCVCVPHGYDPAVHLWEEPAPAPQYDLALCATWRPSYGRLMRSLAEALGSDAVSVAVAGSGWDGPRDGLPRHWRFVGPKVGRAYGEFLRAAKIALAPVNTEVAIDGAAQPGDQDSTRTYELAAAGCFFVHQRTDYAAEIYDERSEVPFWSDAAELAGLVRRWLPDERGRREAARKAHARAVPAYSIPRRAESVLRHLEALVAARRSRR